MTGDLKARQWPKLLYLLDNSDAEAPVFHSSPAEQVAAIHDKAVNVRLSSRSTTATPARFLPP